MTEIQATSRLKEGWPGCHAPKRLGRRKSSDADVPYLRISSRNRSSTDICLEIGRTCCELASHHYFGQLVSEE